MTIKLWFSISRLDLCNTNLSQSTLMVAHLLLFQKPAIFVSCSISTFSWRRMWITSVNRHRLISIRKIGRIRKYIDQSTAERLVQSCVYLIQIHKLQGIQNIPLRNLSSGSIKSNEDITPVLQKLHWLPVKVLIIFKLLVRTFKTFPMVLLHFTYLNFFKPTNLIAY